MGLQCVAFLSSKATFHSTSLKKCGREVRVTIPPYVLKLLLEVVKACFMQNTFIPTSPIFVSGEVHGYKTVTKFR